MQLRVGLSSGSGRPTGHFYFFLSTLAYTLDAFPGIRRVTFFMESKTFPHFRYELLKRYKESRHRSEESQMARDLVAELKRELLPRLPGRVVSPINGEADDAIVTMIHREFSHLKGSECQHPHFVTLSRDADFAAYVYSHCGIEIYPATTPNVRAKHRLTIGNQTFVLVKPKFSVDAGKEYFCRFLAGDRSDEIPPVKAGVGPKTAEKLFASSGGNIKRALEQLGVAEHWDSGEIEDRWKLVQPQIVEVEVETQKPDLDELWSFLASLDFSDQTLYRFIPLLKRFA